MSHTAGVWSDLYGYVLRRPAVSTKVRLATSAHREDYDDRILQRLSLAVRDYSVLNIHRIGIDAPTTFVWDAITAWRPDAGYWPNALAHAALPRHPSRPITIRLLGATPLFRLDLLRSQATPGPTEVDNARFLIYRCSGGYPMGIFSLYVRSRIASEGEVEPTQLFFVISFDFFGRRTWMGARLIRPAWESIHDRVTAHSLCRFKAHCESAFATVQTGAHSRDVLAPPNPGRPVRQV